MRYLSIAGVLASVTLLGGCAGMLSQFTDPAINSDKLDEHGELSKLKGMTGDRRLVRVVADRRRPEADWLKPDEPLYYYDVCAETQADAIAARGSSSTVSVVERGSISDASTQSLLLTNQRSVVSDVVRQLSWQLCNARLNDDFSDAQYREALLELQRSTMVVLQQIALSGEKTALPLNQPLVTVNVQTSATPPVTSPPSSTTTTTTPAPK